METVRAWFRGGSSQSTLDANDPLVRKLEGADVPVTIDPCRACPNPCDDNDPRFRHEEWPSTLFLDFSSDILGRVKPYGRQVIISTGKSDWEKEVTDATGTLAYHLSSTANNHPSKKSSTPEAVPGVFSSNSTGRLAILNGSHRSHAEDTSKQTVLVFPDYKMVNSVESSAAGAEALWQSALDPALTIAGATPDSARPTKSWVLPYNAVVLLCSHKRRDNRCAITAPVLKKALTTSLESYGWEVYDQVLDPEEIDHPAIEDLPGSPAEREEAVLAQRKSIMDGHSKKALIIYCSHVGGHKYAGNAIIYLPQGSGVWYGRVSTHEVAAVTNTIIEGKVYPQLLRGGVNITRQKGKTLLDW